ncbi:MAG: transcription termination factor Rho, partial [Marinoscillum sp.]
MYTLDDLSVKLISELRDLAEELGVKNAKKIAKKELIYEILEKQASLPDSEIEKIKKEAPKEEKSPKPERPDRPERKERPVNKKRENVRESKVEEAIQAEGESDD